MYKRQGEEYGVDFTPEQEKKFVTASTFGVPMRSMQKFLDLPTEPVSYTHLQRIVGGVNLQVSAKRCCKT